VKVTLENRSGNDATLIINLIADDYKVEMDKMLKDYGKKMNVPGFRPGKAPIGLVKKMVGSDVKKEVVDKTQQEALQSFVKDNDVKFVLNPISDFTAEEIDWNGDEFTFKFHVGIRPKINIDIKALNELTLLSVQATDDELDAEIESLRQRAAKVEAAEAITADEEGIIMLTLTELDDDNNILEGGVSRTKRYSYTELPVNLQEKLLGQLKDFELNITANEVFTAEELKELFNVDELSAKDIGTVSIKVGAVSKMVLPEFNQSFFDQYLEPGSVNDFDQFKDAWRGVMANFYEQQARNELAKNVREKLVNESNMELPTAFLDKYLLLSYEKETAEELEDYEGKRSGLDEELTWMLITEKVSEENDIEVTDEEITDYTAVELERQFWQMGYTQGLDSETLKKYAKDYLAKDNMYNRTALGLRDGKVFENIINQLTPNVQTVSVKEFDAMKGQNTSAN